MTPCSADRFLMHLNIIYFIRSFQNKYFTLLWRNVSMVTGLKFKIYYSFTFSFSGPEVGKLFDIYFSRPQVGKLFHISFFLNWSWKIMPYLHFLELMLESCYLFIFSQAESWKRLGAPTSVLGGAPGFHSCGVQHKLNSIILRELLSSIDEYNEWSFVLLSHFLQISSHTSWILAAINRRKSAHYKVRFTRVFYLMALGSILDSSQVFASVTLQQMDVVCWSDVKLTTEFKFKFATEAETSGRVHVMDKKIADFDPSWVFPDCNLRLNLPMALKWRTKLNIALKRCPIVF